MARICQSTFTGSCTGLSKLKRHLSTTIVVMSGSPHSLRTEIFWFNAPIDCLSLHAKVALLKKLNSKMRNFSFKNRLKTLNQSRCRIFSETMFQMKRIILVERMKKPNLKKCSKFPKTPNIMLSMTKLSIR